MDLGCQLSAQVCPTIGRHWEVLGFQGSPGCDFRGKCRSVSVCLCKCMFVILYLYIYIIYICKNIHIYTDLHVHVYVHRYVHTDIHFKCMNIHILPTCQNSPPPLFILAIWITFTPSMSGEAFQLRNLFIESWLRFRWKGFEMCSFGLQFWIGFWIWFGLMMFDMNLSRLTVIWKQLGLFCFWIKYWFEVL